MAISGFDKLSRTLNDAQKALREVDGEIGSVSFNPHDPVSIEAAIQKVETLVDEKLGAYASNAIIAPMAEGMKEQYRHAILERAAELRLGGGKNDGED